MNIMDLSASEVRLISIFGQLAEEAFRDEKIINEHFDRGFGLGKKEIHVYHTESCGEYYGDGFLTIDGIFKYHDNWWGGRSYEFQCNAEGIYKMLRMCYLKKHQLEELDPECSRCQIERLDLYFQDFIQSLTNSQND